MSKITVFEFSKDYYLLTAKLKKDKPMSYLAGLLLIKSEELKKGYYAYKINKPTSKGTRIKFKPLESQEQANEKVKEINEEIKAFNSEEFANENI